MAFRTKKISQMDPKGSNLASTDLLEISELVSGSYITKSITGAEIIASVPPTSVDWGDIGGTLSSQTDLQTALNAKVTGNTAITGATKTKITYDSKGLVTSGADATTADIADSTNKRYVTDANLTVIGNTSGTNTGDQTLSGLGGVPTSRTLTINGTTQDLSADRTFTISTGITIGTTAITSGTVGRVLFEGTGNVVQESANLFWDNTNGRLGIGGTPGAFNLDLVGTARISDNVLLTNGIIATSAATTRLQSSINYFAHNRISSSGLFGFLINYVGSTYSFWRVNDANADIEFGGFGILKMYTNNAERMRIFSDGNIGVNTTTNGGFKVDVNGTERVTGGSTIQTLTIGLGAGAIATNHALGFRALEANTTGSGNTGVGYIALLRTTTGASNVALGSNVLQANITGSNNVGVGFNALKLITANHNVGVGTEVLSATTTGQANTAIGNYALNIQTTGGNNVALGYNTQSGNFSGCVIIGKDAVATASNQFVIGSTGTNAGTVTTEVNASTQVWNVIINGVARKILLA